MMHRFFAWIAATVGAILNFNSRPAPEPVVRFNEHAFARRVYGKALSGTALARSMFAGIQSGVNRLLNFGGISGGMLSAGLLNTFMEPLPTFAFQAAAKKADLPESLYIDHIMCVITGTLDVANGAADGTLQTEPIARLIDRLTVKWDGFDLVGPISGRDIAAISRRVQAQTLSTDDITSAGVQAGTEFKLPFIIPFSRQYLADPFNTVLPPLQVNNEFVLEIKWAQDKSNSNAATTAGSGAIIAGGDRDVVLSDVQLEATTSVARNGAAPWYLPVISAYETEQFSAANPRLVLDMRSPRPFDGVLFRTLEDAAQDPANLISDLTFKSSQVRILDNVGINTLRAGEERIFPGVQAASEVGSNFVLFAGGGKLGNAVIPAELSNPEFNFNVAAPSANPGFIRAVVMELYSVEGVTQR